MATNTAASFTNHTGNGTAGPFSISFSYLSEAEVDVTVGGVLKTLTTHYTFTSATQITFTSGNEPGNGVAINIQRDTNITAKKVDFNDGSVLTESDLDTQNDQILFAVQENLRKLDTIEENATGDQTDAEIRTAVGNATDSNVFTDAEKTKLAGISTGATTDQTASDIRTLVENASDSNVFTDADHTKLNAIEDNATADQSNSEIKTAYEANSDTNAFTDAEKTKLSGIATGAEVNVQSDFNATSGDAVILNKPTIPSALNDLSDVNTAGVADGKILKYDNSSSAFVIADETGGGGGGSSTFTGLSDTPANFGSAAGKTVKVNAAGNALEFVTVTTPNTDLDQDSSPQLAANLDVQTNEITTSTTNGNIKLNPNGTGVVEVKGDGSSADGTLQLNCSQNSHGIKLKSPPHSASASYTFTFPQNIQNGQFLTTDANGNTSWSAIDLTALSASNLTSGTVPDARFPATLPAASAANLTAIPAANITGTLPAISAANLTNIPAANITGTLPAIDGSNLTGIVAGATGGGSDQAFFEGDQNVTTSYTLTANKNAMAISPTIDSGATITVPSGAILVIL